MMMLLQGLVLLTIFAVLFWLAVGRRIWRINWRFTKDPTLFMVAATIIFVFVVGIIVFLAE
jgi:hypothetical protein